MSETEWEGGRQSDAESVDPSELDDVPAGTAEAAETGSGWTEGGGTLGPETEGAPGTEVGGWTESGAGAEDIAGGDTAGASELRERMGDEESR